MTTNQIAELSDDALIDAVARAAATERDANVHLLRLLMEVDRRRLYLGRGYASLFMYCTRSLRLSEQAAYSRITAARVARRFPRLLDELGAGILTLSSVGLLAPHLEDDNADALIDAASGKSTRDVERMIAAVHTQPDIPSSVRPLPNPQPQQSLTMERKTERKQAVITSTPAVIAPIAPTRFLLKVTISTEAHERLQRLRALMRHSVPNGDPAEIVERALSLLLQQVERTKIASVEQPRQPGANVPTGRTIPAAVRREVWRRDAGRCAFDGVDGRCTETAFLEFHHVVPFAAGGAATVDNIQLRCRPHNGHEALLFFAEDSWRDGAKLEAAP